MTSVYQTYLHPGVAASLLAQSRKRRADFIARRDGTYVEPQKAQQAILYDCMRAAGQSQNWLQSRYSNPYLAGCGGGIQLGDLGGIFGLFR